MCNWSESEQYCAGMAIRYDPSLPNTADALAAFRNVVVITLQPGKIQRAKDYAADVRARKPEMQVRRLP